MHDTFIQDFGLRLDRFMVEAKHDHSPVEEAKFNALAIDLFRFQFASNEVYRRVCISQGKSPNTVGQWAEIPRMPVNTFKEYEVSCLSPGERMNWFESSGTTRQRRSRHFHSKATLEIYQRSLLNGLKRIARPDKVDVDFETLQLLFLTPPIADAPRSSLVHMFETIATQWRPNRRNFTGRIDPDAGGWTLDVHATRREIDAAIEASRPVFIFATAFSLVELLDALRVQGRLKLPAGSRILETGGYKGRSRQLSKLDLHRYVHDLFGISYEDIISEYGMSELSSQAYSFQFGGWFHFPPWTRVKIISPDTSREVENGETGLICVWDLANVGSAMAIQTEDLGIRRETGFELIGRAALAEPKGCSLMSVDRS